MSTSQPTQVRVSVFPKGKKPSCRCVQSTAHNLAKNSIVVHARPVHLKAVLKKKFPKRAQGRMGVEPRTSWSNEYSIVASLEKRSRLSLIECRMWRHHVLRLSSFSSVLGFQLSPPPLRVGAATFAQCHLTKCHSAVSHIGDRYFVLVIGIGEYLTFVWVRVLEFHTYFALLVQLPISC